ncbi:MAG TPA: hypothetical protein VHL11_10470 [Phototrophicaceae bacterium]|jgi:hypothetical protein|nr:hypothetical protein [Phototrophicaceae bacterium]
MAFNEFGEFFAQMPPPLIFNMCLIMASIIGLIVYFSVIKPMRQRNRSDNSATGTSSGSGSQKSSSINDSMSMPDLDALGTIPPQATYTPPAAPRPQMVIPPRRTGEYSVKLKDGQTARAIEVLAILRDSADDRLIVQVDNTGYRTLLDNPDIKNRFTTLMKELAETIAKPDTPRPTTQSVVESEPDDIAAELQSFRTEVYEPETYQPDDQPEVYQPYSDGMDDLDLPDLDSLSTIPTPMASSPMPPTRPKPVSAPILGADGKIPGALPNYRAQPTEPKKVIRKGLFRPPQVEFEPIPELNIASAIETYLQHKLQFTPEYADHEIHIHSAPGGGVRIQVDQAYYDAVGDVADPEIRDFISSTIQEWQQHLQ